MKTLRENFDSALALNEKTGCLEWQRSITPYGYGQLYSGANDRPIKAHRFAWERAYGPIPDGMVVCHKCDNRKCCNVDHLFVGTIADNNRDGWKKGRMKAPPVSQVGERHHFAKLTADMVRAIREEARHASQRALAKKYGLSQSSVGAAIRGKTWASA